MINKLNIIEIDSSRECLKFLQKRILSDNYRGVQLSQHNRFTSQKIIVMLKVLYELQGTNIMKIRTTDLSKRPYNTPDENDYANYINLVNKKIAIGTQDSIRKNFFVDLHRMGLINRYNDKIALNPFDRKKVTGISISKRGIELISKDDNIKQQYMLYTECINDLMQGFILKLFDIFNYFEYITFDEFLFFVSFIDNKIDGYTYLVEDIKEFIFDYRKLSIFSKNEVIKRIKEYANPNNFVGNKINKRDYHNWVNESQQIISLLDQTSFFEYVKSKNRIILKVDKPEAFFDEESVTEITNFKRSLEEKNKYFKNHGVSKQPGYELHHIIPIFRATDIHHFELIDKWDNLIYIDAKSHSIITYNKTSQMQLEILDNDDVILKDFSNEIHLVKDVNVYYSTNNKQIMLDKNKKLLNTL
ncbi:Type-2 restriction enzyme MboII [Mycoplasma feriruminatoris]|uniref:hypothetical protein n=1 Tax=Mycoplasma feriruminatoris TaxID=1179777 RepID=UPI00241E3963|nr:hypothetical protein [Mycoplasma feriruminatoris]WFQ90866.1 Type-2 restriction enzyme MboII [Mycoplasma feriruminatoris]